MAQAQREFFDRENEAGGYLSADRVGFFSLLVGSGKTKKQSSHRLTDMPTVLRLVDKSRDSWLSQAEFMAPNRRVVNLARIGLLFSDLDTYNCEWSQGKSPDQLAQAVLFGCADAGIPEPSILIYSGRGIQAKWLLDGPLPRQALPRWNACQKHLVNALRPWGADSAARDASRVLRLVDTVNTKSGAVCQVIHVNEGADGLPKRYDFEELCEWILPIARSELEDAKRARELRKAALQLVQGSAAVKRLKGFSGRQLSWDRLEDLRKLATLRGGVAENMKTTTLFWQLNFLLLSGATNSQLMYHEAAELAKNINPKWSHRAPELSTLYSKAKAHEAGELVEHGKYKLSPLYTPKNDTLINIFQITDEEQAQLKTIISPAMAAARHRARETSRRRAAGAVERADYLKAAQDKRQQAIALKEQGLSVRKIALQLSISVGAVSGYLKGVQSPCV